MLLEDRPGTARVGRLHVDGAVCRRCKWMASLCVLHMSQDTQTPLTAWTFHIFTTLRSRTRRRTGRDSATCGTGDQVGTGLAGRTTVCVVLRGK